LSGGPERRHIRRMVITHEDTTMNLDQMFPSKFLQAEDLTPNQNTIVTIARIYPGAAKGRNADEAEVKWLMRFQEMRKPMSLWRSTAKQLAEMFESTNTDHWIGKQIAIYPSTYLSYGEMKPCINVDKWRPEQVKPVANQSVGTSLVIAHDVRPIPAAAMERFINHAKERGKTWEDFLRFCKASAPEALTLAWGVELEAIPCGILPAMKAFLDSVAVAPAASQATQQVDKVTGEVIDPAKSGAPLNFKPSKAPAPVDDDDIPF
jgi:hypothetical protein